ncbi:MAG TPA: bifunctional proline dehydrogenase/L-glutamate gamma-semialdehyde dehydrogenase PutA [Steroidobacteraceae bacterium]|jgi:RHH-type proline utilization regulon transcriptional repressor/proline dehydrogenase/delta 1-pyrroline-5-carboxylate dehydrogenase|nr:bifunctional proline dehydrogenase/L-glutamate gamma-semialdehyde dehydrogenase PutA [Steroidobacteraceae bacterium]
MAASGMIERIGGAGTLAELRARLRAATLRPEAGASDEALADLAPSQEALERARVRAARWVQAARAEQRSRPLVERMLEQFPLDSAQGKALMSLAEALLRTSDPKRADQLIAERLATIREVGVPGDTDLLLRTGFTLLGAAGRLLPDVLGELAGEFSTASLTRPVVAPVVRAALRQSMQLLGHAFIVGETIDEALARGADDPELALCSYDVLGEGARTEVDAQRYYEAYAHAIEVLQRQAAQGSHARSGISVKLSALEPRYTLLQSSRVLERLAPRMLELARSAATARIGFTIDAEEADRLDLSLDILETLARDARTRAWDGLGLAVQAYGRRAPLVIAWVAQLARASGRQLSVRLVKGAYWDSEIKRAQERGLASFPVYTSKAATDASYLECVQHLFAARDVLYPQFATHNAYTVAAVLELAPQGGRYEFQRLHGMGEALYAAARAELPDLPPVRVYAPVGTHEELLPYLVRRLLENGANTSFVHQFMNPQIPVEEVVRDPVTSLAAEPARPARLREPGALFGPERANSAGEDFGDPATLAALEAALRAQAGVIHSGGPILSGRAARAAKVPVSSPANTGEVVGYTRDATAAEIRTAMQEAAAAQPEWDATPAEARAACLLKAADLLQQRRETFLSLLVREAGKTLPDAMAELREAVDFCRYYAARGRELFAAPEQLPGPTGERNTLALNGRGVFVCISPWNFPLAIFTGQISAALMAGNAVVAKPAPATPLIAHAMTRVLHEAGVPPAVLQLAPADGPPFGEVALTHPALAGVAFTGSTATASTINRTLANRPGAIVPLIAETGGVNAMVVDATALAEQVVDDVVTSAFTSAGQRCSALRVLYLQEEIAERVITMLIGAMRELKIGPPEELSTDVGPVIGAAARARLARHAGRMRREARLLYACELDAALAQTGHFFPPHLFELKRLDQLATEEFGPILHVARYRSDQLPEVLAAIRSTGFGLTLGIHTRVESLAEHVFRALPVGNTYVNRNMIGAVVGVQPFGGQGLSGTGPKAGGPHYLLRFANERTLTINTAAIGGNVELLS